LVRKHLHAYWFPASNAEPLVQPVPEDRPTTLIPGRKVPTAVHGPKISNCVLTGGAAVVEVDAVAGGALVVFTAVGDAGAVVAGVAMVVEPAPADGVGVVVHPDERRVTTRAMTPPVAAMIVGFMMFPTLCELVPSPSTVGPDTGAGRHPNVACGWNLASPRSRILVSSPADRMTRPGSDAGHRWMC
jgi:hypothetical protein